MLSSVLCLLLLPFMSYAQQYEGEAIPNSLPTTPGSTITYFKVDDGNGGTTTLINYFSRPNGKKQDSTKVKRAIVVLHGLNRDPATYFSTMWATIGDANKLNSNVTESSVAIMAPYFPSGEDKGTGYPWVDGMPAGEGSTSNALVWRGSQWAYGENNQYPHDQQTVSSYSVLDQILQYFDNKDIYPNLNQIVVAGHSLGAQMVHRYAAVGEDIAISTPIVYWIGNPSTFLWLDENRPESITGCSDYNDWKEGLDNYDPEYNNAWVTNWADGSVRERYESRNIAYARGLNDHGGQTDTCAAATTGSDRGERFENFLTQFPPDENDTVDYYQGVGHSAPEMFYKQPGVYRLFLDNFNGNNSRHADFGPRQVVGDNPHPNST